MDSRHVAVLGGSAGIGLETAGLLAGRGARVTIGGRNRAGWTPPPDSSATGPRRWP